MGYLYGKPVTNCPACKKPIGEDHPHTWCIECGEPLPPDILSLIPAHAVAANAATRDAEERERVLAKASSIILTTADWIEGYRVSQTLEVITAECAFGMNLFRDFFAGIRDIFGGRSVATQTVLRDARKKCLEELRLEAAKLGADGVIAIDLDYSEFSGQGKSMLFLVASGTAVRLTIVGETTPRDGDGSKLGAATR